MIVLMMSKMNEMNASLVSNEIVDVPIFEDILCECERLRSFAPRSTFAVVYWEMESDVRVDEKIKSFTLENYCDYLVKGT